MQPITVFSYGSNLLSSRIVERVKSFNKVAVGYIKDYKLQFSKISKDTSGKATIIKQPHSKVYGLVFTISKKDLVTLDKVEGYKSGYDRMNITVNLGQDQVISAVTYIAQSDYIDTNLKPYQWYLNYVLFGAIENNLPYSYIFQLRNIQTLSDTDWERVEKNHRILIK